MLTSEAAIKAIIESVIKKSQSNHELEQITTGPGENLSQSLNPNHNLTKEINLQSDLEGSSTEHNSCSLEANNGEKEPSERTTSQTIQENANMGNLKDEKKKTRTQVNNSIRSLMLIRF